MLKKTIFQVLIGIFLLANILFWCGKKEGFHADEIYSYHFISEVEYPSINADRAEINYLNTWHTAEYYSDYFAIAREEAFDLAGTWNSIKEDVHPPIYYLLLELICSLLFIDRFTIWSGLILNIIFFVLTIGILYLLAKKLTDSSGAMLVCLAYGFSIGAVNTIVFIRMYMVLTFATVCICYIHTKLWEYLIEKDIDYNKRMKWYIGLMATMLLGTLTQYYFWIFAFFLCGIFFLCILLYRKWKFALEYAGIMLVSVITSILIWPDFFSDLFSGYRGEEAIKNLKESHLWENIKKFCGIIDEEVFSGVWTFLLDYNLIKGILLVFVLFGVIYVIKKRHTKEDLAVGQIIVTAGAYLLVIAKISPYRTDRYIFNIFPLIILAFIVTLLRVICRLKQQMLIKSLVTVMLLFMVFIGYQKGNVEYLYAGTHEKMNIISEYKDASAVLITNNNRRMASCENSIYLKEISFIYPTDLQGINDLSTVLTSGYGNGQYLLFVDRTLPEVENIVNQIIDSSKAVSWEYIFKTGTCDVYVINV